MNNGDHSDPPLGQHAPTPLVGAIGELVRAVSQLAGTGNAPLDLDVVRRALGELAAITELLESVEAAAAAEPSIARRVDVISAEVEALAATALEWVAAHRTPNSQAIIAAARARTREFVAYDEAGWDEERVP